MDFFLITEMEIVLKIHEKIPYSTYFRMIIHTLQLQTPTLRLYLELACWGLFTPSQRLFGALHLVGPPSYKLMNTIVICVK